MKNEKPMRDDESTTSRTSSGSVGAKRPGRRRYAMVDENSASSSSGSSCISKRLGGWSKQQEQPVKEIPLMDGQGRVLSPGRRAVFATRMGLTKCGECGIKTHRVKNRLSFTKITKLKLSHHREHKYLTNENVYEGICIKCNPSLVPSKVLREFQR